MALSSSSPAHTLHQLRESIAELPDRIRTGARVARQSGLLYTFKLPGIRVALAALTSGSRNPSLLFQIHAANTPDKPALLWRDQSLTFKQLDDRMNRAGIGLQRRGFKPETIAALKSAIRTLFFSKMLREEAIAKTLEENGNFAEVRRLVDFINNSKRGVVGRERE